MMKGRTPTKHSAWPPVPGPGFLRAYTLVEVLIVVTVIGIAGAVVVPAMLRGGTMSVQAAGRMVISDLLYAQNEAIAQQAPRRIVFEPATNRYRLTDAAGQPISVSWQGGDYVVDFARDRRFAGVTLENAVFDGGAVVEFDALGAPSSGGSVELVADAVRYRVSVAPITGRVTIAAVP